MAENALRTLFYDEDSLSWTTSVDQEYPDPQQPASGRRIVTSASTLKWQTDPVGLQPLCWRFTPEKKEDEAAPPMTGDAHAPVGFLEIGGIQLSVIPKSSDGWQEVDSNYIYGAHPKSLDMEAPEQAAVYDSNSNETVLVTRSFRPEPPIFKYATEDFVEEENIMSELESLLRGAVADATSTPAEPGCGEVNILFSGGLDSTILAAVASDTSSVVNLWNVSFDGAAAPDRLTALASYIQLVRRARRRAEREVDLRLFCYDVPRQEHEEAHELIMAASRPRRTLMDFTIGSTLFMGCRMRGKYISYDQACQLLGLASDPILDDDDPWATEKTLLSLLNNVDDTLCSPHRSKWSGEEEVEPEPLSQQKSHVTLLCGSCERYAAKAACGYCRRCCESSGRKNMEYRCQPHRVNRLAEPMTAAIQLSLKRNWPSVYEALPPARDRLAETSSEGEDGRCTLLCGNGADELFGGYGRYRTCENQRGLKGWRNEMVLDLRNLWSKNLGRDYRVLATATNHRVRARLPFLDPRMIKYVARVSTTALAHGVAASNLSKHTSGPPPLSFSFDKALLRELARDRLDLMVSSRLKKRAMQFGSRSATAVFVGTDHSRRSFKGDSVLSSLSFSLPSRGYYYPP